MAPKPTLEAIALLGEFGFEFVAADQVGEPTPGRIADRLSEIIAALEDANARGNPGAVRQAVEKLKRLQQAIDVWSLLASELEDNPAPQAPPPAPAIPTRPPAAAPPPAPIAQPVAPPQSAAPPMHPPPPIQPPPPPIQATAPQTQPPAPVPAAAMPAPPAATPPAPEYPAPPVPDAPLDVERLELAAAGTQQAFWQTIGQTPANQDKK
jgi:hypothetical protein